MKKRFVTIVLLSCILALSACGNQAHPAQTTIIPTTVPPTTISPTTLPPTEPTQAPTEAPHSALYIPGVSVEDVILYFNEVCLDAEFVNGGDPSVLQKWMEPISFILHGEPTEEDKQTLYAFTDWLNTIEGFPGIQETQDPVQANLRIHFCTEEEMLVLMGPDYTYMDGAVTFWYLDNAIYDAIICCRTDLDQTLRNSVILEEIYNGLGPVQDTNLRPDSIIYSEFSQPQSLTQMDELLLKLLYHSEMQCGMDAQSCEAVIRQLYY